MVGTCFLVSINAPEFMPKYVKYNMSRQAGCEYPLVDDVSYRKPVLAKARTILDTSHRRESYTRIAFSLWFHSFQARILLRKYDKDYEGCLSEGTAGNELNKTI